MATAADVRALDWANEFACFSDQQIQCLIDNEAACCVGDAWGDKADRGIALAAAHIMSISKNGSDGPAGPVTGESAGGLSISYAGVGGSSPSEAYWMQSSFGRRFFEMRKCVPTTPLTLRCC